MSLSDHEVRDWAEGVAACDVLFATGATAPHSARVLLDEGTIGTITGAAL